MPHTLPTLQPNPEKNLIIDVSSDRYARYPIKTHVVTREDDLLSLCEKYVKPHLQPGDILFVSERIVAITQGRAYPIKDIHPSRLARFLVRFVHKSPYGIGLGSPWTMELAIREAGPLRILLAAAISGVSKLFGMKGVFYKLVGRNINAIDGPCSYTLPPFNEYAKLGPADPDRVVRELFEKLSVPAVIIDANDLGVAVLGRYPETLSEEFCTQIFRDNPLGQTTEQTPLCIVRKLPYTA